MDQVLEEQLESEDPRERAKAIKTMALSGKQEYLDILKDLHEFDPEPKIKEYARKAALHIYQNNNDEEDQSPQPVQKESFKPQAGELTSVSLNTTPKKIEKEGVSRPDRERAAQLVQRAFTFYSTDKPKKAIKAFTKALEINPGLEGETFAANLAMEITGLTKETAFASIRGEKAKKELLESLKEKEPEAEETTSKTIRPISGILLVIALIALGLAAWYLVDPGILDRLMDLINSFV
jgi:tetratricopeptide (TPR) repeat protein